MKLHLKSLIPTKRELLLCSILAVLLTVACNSIHIFNQYISSWIGTANRGDARALALAMTTRIDAWQPSTAIITFLAWALLGLMVAAMYQGLQHTTRRVIYLRRMSSRRVRQQHPWATAVLWKQWALTTVGSFAAFASALFLLCLTVLCLMPVGVVYTRVFVAVPNVLNTFFGLMGVTTLVLGLLLVFVAIRLIYHRRRLIRLT